MRHLQPTGVDLFCPFYLRFSRSQENKDLGSCFHLRNHSCHTFRNCPGFVYRGFASQHIKNGLRPLLQIMGHRLLVRKASWRRYWKKEEKKWKIESSPGDFRKHDETKTALKVIVDQQILFAKVECLVNSRPPGYSSNDANKLQSLSPTTSGFGRATADVQQIPFREMTA